MKSTWIGLLALCACSTERLESVRSISLSGESFHGKVVFDERTSSSGFKISLVNDSNETLDRLVFDYPLYHIDSADVDRDGKTDILVGLIKRTRFDPTKKKRLFILRIDHGQLRPLWLGSRVCQELISFKTLDQGIVKTLEKTRSGSYSIGLYEWRGFGLKLLKYQYEKISLDHAQTLFDS